LYNEISVVGINPYFTGFCAVPNNVQPMPVIGYLSARSPEDTAHLVDAFRRGLREAGFVEGQNVTVEYRWAFGQHDRLPALAADLVHKSVAVLVSTGGESAALAAKAATRPSPSHSSSAAIRLS